MTDDIFSIQKNLSDSLQEALQRASFEPVPISIEKPKDPSHGDFAAPLAMVLAKRTKCPPLPIAQELIRLAPWDPQVLGTAQAVAPGFINITLKPEVYHAGLEKLISQAGSYGTNSQESGIKVLLEFVSANPTGPLNVVSARAAALGDSIANLLAASGAQVSREYYVNDAGVQARLFGESLLAACDRVQGGSSQAPENGYQGAYMEDLAKEYLALGDPKPEPSRWGMDRVLRWHEGSLQSYGVRFDRWFSEKKELHEPGLVAKALETLRGKGLVYEKDGAVWIKVSEFGAPKDEVLVKSDGQFAYFAADIAYHAGKFQRGFDRVLDIWGPDHHGHILRMRAALQSMGFPVEGFTVLIAQQVNLMEGDEKVKMSKREGKFVTMDELMGKVGKDAARFFFVMRSANTHLDFDIQVAQKRTEENPVFYIQYAHARICSLLRRCAEKGWEPARKAGEMAALTEPESILLLKELIEYPRWVAESARAYEPHRIVVYLQSLAGTFHLFYSKHRILDASEGTARARLALALGTRQVLRNALGLLGVSAPEQM